MVVVHLRRPGRSDTPLEVPSQGLVVGRSGGAADLALDEDSGISRRHGRLWREGDSLYYEDLGSSNGSWIGGQRIEGPLCLVAGMAVKLGDASLVVLESMSGVPVPVGLELLMQARTIDEPLSEVLSGRRSALYMAALYEFVQGLLRSTSRELIHAAMKRIHEVVPAARRISLVAWPPGPDGKFRPLAPDGWQEPPSGEISLSLARYAVENGQALLLAEAEKAESPDMGASIVRHGIRSAVYVPLTDGEATLGLLCVDTPSPTLPFTTDDFQFIRALGSLVATALTAEGLREEARRREMEVREQEVRRQAMAGFLQIASHDLKNPLACILGAAKMLVRQKPRPDDEELVELILTSGQRAHSLIKTYLDMAAADSKLQIEWSQVDLDRLLDEEIALVKSALEDSSVTFDKQLGCATARADESKLRQILGNLLSNAAKYSPAGGVVTVQVEASGSEVLWRVKDQGVGIAPPDQARLFQQFQRVGDTRLKPGTGLGLWLARSLVEAHGGRIGVESAQGQGSTFYFSLPAG